MGSNVKRRETRMEGSEKENDTWWEKAKYSKTINAYAVFVQKKAEESKTRISLLVLRTVRSYGRKRQIKRKRNLQNMQRNLFVQFMKGKEIPKGKTFLQFVLEKWDKLSQAEKEEFEKKLRNLRSSMIERGKN